MAQVKNINIKALFVWFRLYVIMGYEGQFNKENLEENLQKAEEELRQLENKENLEENLQKAEEELRQLENIEAETTDSTPQLKDVNKHVLFKKGGLSFEDFELIEIVYKFMSGK